MPIRAPTPRLQPIDAAEQARPPRWDPVIRIPVSHHATVTYTGTTMPPLTSSAGTRVLAPRRQRHTQSVSRALDILLCFTAGEPTWTLTDLSRRLKLYKSTVHRLLRDLEARELLWYDPETERLRLGVRFLELGGVVQDNLPLRRAALPTMKRLAEQTGETVALNVRDGPDALCVELIEGSSRVRLVTRAGRRVPLHVGSGARAILSFLPDEEIRALVDEHGLPAFSEKTITDGSTLLRLAREARTRGYTSSFEETGPSAAGLGAPILDTNGRACGSLSIMGLAERFPAERIPSLAEALSAAAREVSQTLASLPPAHRADSRRAAARPSASAAARGAR